MQSGDWVEVEAFSEGRLAGRREDGWAGQCPFDERSPALRLAWMRGFSAGRMDAAARLPSQCD